MSGRVLVVALLVGCAPCSVSMRPCDESEIAALYVTADDTAARLGCAPVARSCSLSGDHTVSQWGDCFRKAAEATCATLPGAVAECEGDL